MPFLQISFGFPPPPLLSSSTFDMYTLLGINHCIQQLRGNLSNNPPVFKFECNFFVCFQVISAFLSFSYLSGLLKKFIFIKLTYSLNLDAMGQNFALYILAILVDLYYMLRHIKLRVHYLV